ncbi:LysR family transcriptional regulator [Xylocopilactobacillus apicola]|uniref:LysR family transcriptional regulator n=1 Tax=Xylocopilactobacillus apicola TaxID=2932184 RepID=A0AAU9DDK3_9LACO|nr:LysR family transcriptional regulator [Xylocopilactobacillus apicola]BDR58907.1 LysR family transcriptional regulator [Xylocopilactobacillus apicola]
MFQQMKYFISVVQHHNFTRAAQECNISQSAISQQIKELENTLGVQLLERRGRSFELTEAGQYFYQQAQEIIGDVDNLISATQAISQEQNNDYVLKLGYLVNFGVQEFLQAVAQFSKMYPTVKVQITNGAHEPLFELLRNDQIDLNFSDQRRALSNEYNNEFLTETDYVAIVGKNFAQKDDNQITTDQLRQLPCILVGESSEQAEEENYYQAVLGIKSQFKMVPTFDEAQILVAANQGYLVANSLTAEQVNKEINRVLPLLKRNTRLHQKYYAYWKKENSGFYIETFAEILKNQFYHDQKNSDYN